MEAGAKFQVPAAEQGYFAAGPPGRHPAKNQHDGENARQKVYFASGCCLPRFGVPAAGLQVSPKICAPE